MNKDLPETYRKDREERMKNTLPTRDDLVKPTLGNYNRRQAEDAERIANHRREQAVGLLTRSLGRTPTEAEITEALQR